MSSYWWNFTFCITSLLLKQSANFSKLRSPRSNVVVFQENLPGKHLRCNELNEWYESMVLNWFQPKAKFHFSLFWCKTSSGLTNMNWKSATPAWFESNNAVVMYFHGTELNHILIFCYSNCNSKNIKQIKHVIWMTYPWLSVWSRCVKFSP